MSERRRTGAALGAAGALGAAAFILAGAASANPFGVGVAEPAMAPGGEGALGALVTWIAVHQAAFYRAMTAALAGIGSDPGAGWWLVALSFLYGVFHAAGPGHGKAVISAYVLADRQTIVRAAALSFGAAFVQATSAVVLVLVAVLVIGMTSVAIGEAARTIEIASYGVLVAIGAGLVWRKALRPLVAAVAGGPRATAARSLSADHVLAAPGPQLSAVPAPNAAGGPRPDAGPGYRHDHHAHHGGACCGHAHAVTPETANRAGDWRGAVAVMVSVGLRPCSGGIIVLVFALAAGLLPWGLAAVYAMAVGVGATVAVIAAVAVLAGGASRRSAETSGSGAAAIAFLALEATAALAVLAIGLLLLLAAVGR